MARSALGTPLLEKGRNWHRTLMPPLALSSHLKIHKKIHVTCYKKPQFHIFLNTYGIQSRAFINSNESH